MRTSPCPRSVASTRRYSCWWYANVKRACIAAEECDTWRPDIPRGEGVVAYRPPEEDRCGLGEAPTTWVIERAEVTSFTYTQRSVTINRWSAPLRMTIISTSFLTRALGADWPSGCDIVLLTESPGVCSGIPGFASRDGRRPTKRCRELVDSGYIVARMPRLKFSGRSGRRWQLVRRRQIVWNWRFGWGG